MFAKALKYRNTYQLYAFLIIASATIFLIFGLFLFRRFGPSLLVMGIMMAGLFALFLLGLYLLTYRLYSPRFALVTIAFLALGTVSMLVRQLKATGGNAEINVFGVFILLIS